MNTQAIGKIRALVAFQLRSESGCSFRDIRDVMRLTGPGEARTLEARGRRVAAQLLQKEERTCVECGCSDSRACVGGCSWAVKHKATNTGVCSSCVPIPYAVVPVDLLTGIKALAEPDYHKLNRIAGRNDRLLHVALCAYAKHQLDHPDIGWAQLGAMLNDAICNEIGDDQFLAWVKRCEPHGR